MLIHEEATVELIVQALANRVSVGAVHFLATATINNPTIQEAGCSGLAIDFSNTITLLKLLNREASSTL